MTTPSVPPIALAGEPISHERAVHIALVLEMSELSDRNSPEDDPSAMVADSNEMAGCIVPPTAPTTGSAPFYELLNQYETAVRQLQTVPLHGNIGRFQEKKDAARLALIHHVEAVPASPAASVPHPAIARAIAQEERACRAEDALIDLVNQIRKSNPVDDHGHDLKMNRAYLEAAKLLDSTAPTTGSAPDAFAKDAVTREEIESWAKLVGIPTMFEKHLEQLGDFAIFARQSLAASPAASALTDAQIMQIYYKTDGVVTRRDADIVNFARALLAASMGGDRK
jgi:hypothetical protein